MHKKFEINQTKIMGGCHSGRKVVTHNSKSDLPLEQVVKCHFYLIRHAIFTKKWFLKINNTFHQHFTDVKNFEGCFYCDKIVGSKHRDRPCKTKMARAAGRFPRNISIMVPRKWPMVHSKISYHLGNFFNFDRTALKKGACSIKKSTFYKIVKATSI